MENLPYSVIIGIIYAWDVGQGCCRGRAGAKQCV